MTLEQRKLMKRNQQFLESGARLTLYVSELSYPALQITLPVVFNDDVLKEIDLAWLGICIDGAVGDIAAKLDRYWITNSKDIYLPHKKAEEVYPPAKICDAYQKELKEAS